MTKPNLPNYILNPFVYWGCPKCKIIETTSRYVFDVRHEHDGLTFELVPHKIGRTIKLVDKKNREKK